MKYFGKKSLSAFMSALLHVMWYVVLGASIAALVIAALIGIGMATSQEIASKITAEFAKGFSEMSAKEQKEWQQFAATPIYVKMIILPYLFAVIFFLLKIIKKAQFIFTNFKNDIVFNKTNVELISKLSKLMIIFSILTFDFSALMTSIFLLMLCEIFSKGSALQEEHDLTV